MLGVVRPPWPVTLTSVLLGAVGHVVSDSFAHGNMPMVGLITPLQRTGPLGEPWWQWLHWTSTVVGAVAVAVITPGVVAIIRLMVLLALALVAGAAAVRLAEGPRRLDPDGDGGAQDGRPHVDAG